jgi:hypothetical protein
MRGPNNSKLGCNRVKYSETRDDKVRFNKIRQRNKIRREKLEKSRPRKCYRRDKF